MSLSPAIKSVLSTPTSTSTSSSKQSMSLALIALSSSSSSLQYADTVSPSPITLLNMRFLQTRIDHLRIKLEHHQERHNALELKDAELSLKMLKHDEAGLYHFYLAAERAKTREAMEKNRDKLKGLKKNLDELLLKN
ncbi:uncharacterized protein LAJ45_01009 [Morchella importuna]|uniref:uncharacterized protein n=1 Tax=Morchella importuna TaxID=1174673 RepID=UPI001E8D575A|nr:uncharacterized protein LAJ45_01009 [Morchella importuna]KAH8154482.1 hypothetical protein LAJ45_01009 [Morchella importuna]